MSEGNTLSTASPNGNELRLFWASFFTLIAAGIGFSARGGILTDWGAQFGFTQTDLGGVTGFALVGFGFTIIFFSFFADKVGYGPLMAIAFFLHASSVLVTLAATPVFAAFGKQACYYCLASGGLLFSLANGTCEAVINPLTATLYPKNKTHWLNILHAGWPGGLVLGTLLALMFDAMGGVRWEIKVGMYLLPTLLYGGMMFGQRFPHSEARVAGVGIGTMLLEFASPILMLLLLLHAMVGYVELGTDSWIQNITERILGTAMGAKMVFIWTSALMFALRFFAGPIVHKISPLGLLFVTAVLGAIGLTLLGSAGTGIACILAATIYGVGKTFFWPTMLGVVSERFPRGGALTLGAIGGVGMLSAGFFGGPGIGYKQDYFASSHLKETAPQAYERYKSADPNSFLIFPKIAGLDGTKVATVNDSGKQIAADLKILEKSGRKLSDDKNLEKLTTWWGAAKPYAAQDKNPVNEAGLFGGKMALRWTALVPTMMALGYLILIFYFKSRGGYKAEVLVGHAAKDEAFTGGVEGPVE